MNHVRVALHIFACCLFGIPAWAQDTIAEPAAPLRSAEELDWLLAPIALYPDPLLAQMLPAATLPGEIVLAARYVNGGGDPEAIDQQPWDPSIQAMARYPVVLTWMDENLAWTMDVGNAFLQQPQEVMESIQRLRAQAQAAGNLAPGSQVNVFTDHGMIEIMPAEPEVIYLPVYDSRVVYIHRSYNEPYVSWKTPLRIGPWLNHDFDWTRRNLVVWHSKHPRPSGWWHCRPSERICPQDGRPGLWQRPGHYGQPNGNPRRAEASTGGGSTVTVINGGSGRRAQVAPSTGSRSSSGVVRIGGSGSGTVSRSSAGRSASSPPARAMKAALAPAPAPARK